MQSDSRLAGEFTIAVFKLNGQMLSAGEHLAQPAGLTVAWWQVLGAVLREPLTASGIAREMGISRQAVQRIANRLCDEGLLKKRDNPNHKRAPLLSPSEAGYVAVGRISPGQTAFAGRIVDVFGRERLERLATDLAEMSKVIDRVGP